MNIRGIGSGYRQKLAKVISSSEGILTPNIVAETLGISRQEAGRILSRWNKQKWVKRLKRGVYVPVILEDEAGELTGEDPMVLADKLFYPGYIAGFSAVKHWDLSEQIFETTTYFTSRQLKDCSPTVGTHKFQLKTIRDSKIFGTKFMWTENQKIPISDPTKTIVDLLDDPSIVGGMRIVRDIFCEYKESKYYDLLLLISYAERLGNKTGIKRLGFLMEILDLKKEVVELDISNRISKGYSLFDPMLKNPFIIRRWNLRVPKNWRAEYDRKK